MSNDKIDVLLCATKMREEEKRIIDFLKKDGLQTQVKLDSMSLPLEVGPSEKRAEIALIRCLSQRNGLNRATLLELVGIETINSVKAISICTNKIYQAIVFEKNKIPQPRYKVAFTTDDLKNSFETFGDIFVIKPASSSWGRGIVRIVGKDCLDGWIGARESFDPRHESFPVLVQEYVDKGDFDIRVIIVGKDPIVAFRRVSSINWKTNTHLGAEVEPLDIDEEIRFISNQVVDVLGEGIYGLDLLYDYRSQRYLVCEVNQNPEFSNSWKIHGVDVAYHISKYVQNRIVAKHRTGMRI